jgi:hypothetical protein
MGAGAIALAVLILTAPRAAHAIVATLVQVTNTAANPAIAQDVSKMASQNVLLIGPAVGLPPHSYAVLQQQFPNGTISALPFVVPVGQSLVVTTIDFYPLQGGGGAGVNFVGISGLVSKTVFEEFYVTNAITSQLQFPNGFVFPAGESVVASNFLSPVPMNLLVHGYLTAN